MTQREAVNPSSGTTVNPIFSVSGPGTVDPFTYDYDENPGTRSANGRVPLTISDLLNSSSLEESVNKKMVQRLAQGIASLDASPVVGVTQTLGGACFDPNQWKSLATQTKEIGTTLAITSTNGTPIAVFNQGNAYVLTQDSTGTPVWTGVDGEAQPFFNLGKADGEAIEATANSVKMFAATAVDPVLGIQGFETTSLPYTSNPKLVMNADGSMSLRAGKKLIGVKTALPRTEFGLVGVSQVMN